jgi:hypothetical protein
MFDSIGSVIEVAAPHDPLHQPDCGDDGSRQDYRERGLPMSRVFFRSSLFFAASRKGDGMTVEIEPEWTLLASNMVASIASPVRRPERVHDRT